ncbi:MAG: SecY family transport protein [Polyangiaceae bacterium]|nr:SecY family transport protein [Polyangiaceae bacterium]
MKRCPNLSCPHRKRVGSAAEFYDDKTTCSDCGADLEAAAPEDPVPQRNAGNAETPSAPPPLKRRLAVTLLVPLIALAAQHLLLPSIDAEAAWSTLKRSGLAGLFASAEGLPGFSVVALGIRPAVTAFLIVEIAAALVPPWRHLRRSGSEGRAKLTWAALALTIPISAFQGFSLAIAFETMDILSHPGILARLLITSSLMAGVFLLLGLAGLIQRYGLGNGFFVMLAGPMLLGEVFGFAAAIGAPPETDPLGPLSIAAVLITAALAVAATLVLFGVPWKTLLNALSRREADPLPQASAATPYRAAPSPVRIGPLPCPTSGLAPLVAAPALLMLPDTLAQLHISLGGVYYFLLKFELHTPIYLAIVAGLAIGFSRLWNPPEQIAEVRARARQDDIESHAAEAKRDLRQATNKTLALLLGMALLKELSLRLVGYHINLIVILMITAVVLDIRAEWRARLASPDLVPIWAEHRPFAVSAALSALSKEGIAAHAQSLQSRVLLQFFGPFVPILIMVRPGQAETARRLAHRVLAGTEAPTSGAPTKSIQEDILG